MMEGTHMPEATLHDGSTIEIEIHGAGPTLLLPVNPQPVTGPLAEQMRQYGTDPALGQSLIKGLSDAFRVVAFDYEGQCLRRPKPDTLTPANTANDLLAVADAAGADRFAYYGYSWLAMIGLQLAIRTDRLWALIRGAFHHSTGHTRRCSASRPRPTRWRAACRQRYRRRNPSGPAWLSQGIRPGNLSRCTRRCKDSTTEPLKRRSPVLVSALWVRRMRSSTASVGEMCL